MSGQQHRLVTAESFKSMVRRGASTDDLANLAVFKAHSGHAKAVEGQERAIEFVLSNANVDREDDSIAVKGWEIDDYKRNPVVLFAHLQSELPIARATKTYVDGDELRAIDVFAGPDLYPFADTVYRMVLGKFLSAVSVGFQPTEWQEAVDRAGGINFLRQSLLEHSVVPVPAHPEALVVARAKGIDTLPLKAWAERTLDLLTHKDADAAIRSQVERLRAQADPNGRRVLAALSNTRMPAGAASAKLLEVSEVGKALLVSELRKAGIPEAERCDACQGSGLQPERAMGDPQGQLDCETCKGSGRKGTMALPDAVTPVPAPTAIPADDAGDGDGSMLPCDACGAKGTMPDGSTCQRCNGSGQMSAPKEAPVVAPVAPVVADEKPVAETKVLVIGGHNGLMQAVLGVSDAPIARRYNPRWSKEFDVEREAFPARSAEQALVAKYIGCEIRQLYVVEYVVSPTRMGSFLSALDEAMVSPTVVDTVRNITHDGREEPPIHNEIELNSTQSKDFVVDGCRYFQHEGQKMALRVSLSWYALEVTIYAHEQQAEKALALKCSIGSRAGQLNFLKGEAFALNGEFLKRDGSVSWDDLFLTDKNQKAALRLAQLINEKGSTLENRGAMLIGPPGTGKTLFGRILLNQTKATYIWLSARDFYYSGGFRGISEAFDIARECAPSVVFIEDVDNYLHGEVVDLMKTEMDGLSQSTGVVTILTTNFPELVPQALMDRPGRFHDVLQFALPDDAARTKMVARWMPTLDASGQAKAVQATAGYSGAHVRELARFTGIIAEQEQLSMTAALDAAIAKLKEQRDLINSIQASGSRYRSALPKRKGMTVEVNIDGRKLAAEVMASMPEVAKAGRVIAKRNVERIKTALGHCERAWNNLGDTEENDLQKAMGHLNALLDDAAGDDDETPGSAAPAGTDPAALIAPGAPSSATAPKELVLGGRKQLFLLEHEQAEYEREQRGQRDIGDVDKDAVVERVRELIAHAIMRATGRVSQ